MVVWDILCQTKHNVTAVCAVSGSLQVYTQHAYKRALGCNIILCGCVVCAAAVLLPLRGGSSCVPAPLCRVDEEKGAQLFKIDCAGHYYGYKVRPLRLHALLLRSNPMCS